MTSLSERHDFSEATVLVTGGTGFIGRHVVRSLQARGVDVTVAGHSSVRAPDAPDAVDLDLTDAERAHEVIAGHRSVVHLAARQGGIQFQEHPDERVFHDNVMMTRNVLNAAVAHGVDRVVLASSAVVYSRDATSPIRETSRLIDPQQEPVSPYAWSKITDEVAGQWARARGLQVLRVRLTNVYGPGGSFDTSNSTVVHSLVRKAVEAGSQGQIEVWGDGSAVRSFVHVQDAGEAIVAVLERGENGRAYNVSTTGPVTIRHLAALVRDTAAPGAHLDFAASKPVGVRERVLDHQALTGLKFSPAYDLAGGILTVADDARARLG